MPTPKLSPAACSALLVLDFLGEVHSQNEDLRAELESLGYVKVDGRLMTITPPGRQRASGFRRLATGVVTEIAEMDGASDRP